MKEFKNANILFCHSDIDDADIPYRAFRVLLHLQRRVGKRTTENANINPGTDSIAQKCKIEQNTVVRELRWLKANGYIEITKAGRAHHYKVLVSRRKLYIDGWLDDYGLSPVQMRVLAHMSRLCGDNVGKTKDGIVQSFCVNKGKFAKVCGLADVKTLVAAIDYLEGEGLHCPYTDASDPLYCLTLSINSENQ
jgi:DNA-binding MarR family transcriptional regulator